MEPLITFIHKFGNLKSTMAHEWILPEGLIVKGGNLKLIKLIPAWQVGST